MSGYHCFSLRAITARKQHRCIYCGEKIELGEQYQRENSISDGHYQNFAWHPECLDEQREYARQGDCEFTAHSADRPPKLEPQLAPTSA